MKKLHYSLRGILQSCNHVNVRSEFRVIHPRLCTGRLCQASIFDQVCPVAQQQDRSPLCTRLTSYKTLQLLHPLHILPHLPLPPPQLNNGLNIMPPQPPHTIVNMRTRLSQFGRILDASIDVFPPQFEHPDARDGGEEEAGCYGDLGGCREVDEVVLRVEGGGGEGFGEGCLWGGVEDFVPEGWRGGGGHGGCGCGGGGVGWEVVRCWSGSDCHFGQRRRGTPILLCPTDGLTPSVFLLT